MPIPPRIIALTWTVAFIVDVVAVGLLAAELARRKRDTGRILLFVAFVLTTLVSGVNAWRWWWVHRNQARAAALLPLVAPAPAVPAR
ncbi:hypothetical protein K438DRAFT_1818749 [Mycena galopus ATCC 62051]|nr:hypothetical protein K438DRAFT_1818749 [Mycena galopus ATCC 62051]